MEKNRIFITCPKGIQPYLASEVQSLGFPLLSESFSGVETEGTLSDTMRLNLCLRTGHRVLYLLSVFYAGTPDELYRETDENSHGRIIFMKPDMSVSPQPLTHRR